MGNSKSFNIQTPAYKAADTSNSFAATSTTFAGEVGLGFPHNPEYFQVYNIQLDSNYGKLYMLTFTFYVFSGFDIYIRLCNSSHETLYESMFTLPENRVVEVKFLLPNPYSVDEPIFIDFKSDTSIAVKNISFYQNK